MLHQIMLDAPYIQDGPALISYCLGSCDLLLPPYQCVPRVAYFDPELASAGMSTAECIQCYVADGYESLRVREGGSDRADMEYRAISMQTLLTFARKRSWQSIGRIGL